MALKCGYFLASGLMWFASVAPMKAIYYSLCKSYVRLHVLVLIIFINRGFGKTHHIRHPDALPFRNIH